MDIAQKETEVLLRKLEKELSDVYKQAVEETEQKIDEYFRKFAYLDLKKRQMVARGELTQEEYAKWRLGKVLIGERWHEMRDTLAKDLVATDKIAYSMVEGYMPEVYALNHNYSTFRVEGISGIDTSYSLYSRETVERLWRDNPSLLYAPGVDVAKDMAWNKKHIQGELTQAILQGEDIRKLSKRMERVVGMDETSARRNARTMITSAQNGGRVDAFTRAKVEYGIDVMNEWLATMDNRVRHSHAVLDGERREIGKAFSNGCKYPGDLSDPNVAPSEVYNCRCTLIPYLPKYTDSDWRDNNAEYDEWKAMHRKALEEKQKKEKPSDNGHDRAVAEKPVVVTEATDPITQIKNQEYQYHATTGQAVFSIYEQGLKTNRGHAGRGVYFAPSEEGALEWTETSSTGGKVLMRVKTKTLAEDYGWAPIDESESTADKKIRPEDIEIRSGGGTWMTLEEFVKKRQTSYRMWKSKRKG